MLQRIIEIEELSMNAWPSLQTKLYDGWVLRFADGYTKRANSVNPIYNSTTPLKVKLDYCENEYAYVNLPIVYKLTSKSQPIGLDEELDKRGYIKLDETSVRLLRMENYREENVGDTYITSQFNDIWTNGFFEYSGVNEKNQMTARKMLDNIIGEVISVSKFANGKLVGCGFGVIEREYVGIFDIIVEKNYRGNGYGKNIMNSILNAAANKGVKTAYLQVVLGNKPAEKLYENLGFCEEYRYWYRAKKI